MNRESHVTHVRSPMRSPFRPGSGAESWYGGAVLDARAALTTWHPALPLATSRSNNLPQSVGPPLGNCPARAAPRWHRH
eukprot:scaffold7830_cov376-Prasinococcus_capsulatus_cf.AAC.2